MSTIKLFVCCHEECPVADNELLVPIQVGAALANRSFPGFVSDASGDNISRLNRSYCELTAQYWAWKNDDSDHVGFFHYRRYLYPGTGDRYPYRIEKAPSEKTLSALGFSAFPALIGQNDLIAPRGENMYVPVREHYASAQFHRAEDLAAAERIVKERSPDYAEALERYFSGSTLYFGNIHIMRRDVFDRYCRWLFPILEEFDLRTDLTDRSPQEKRVDGYLAERLFGVFYTKWKEELRTLELPRVHFDALSGGPDWTKRALYTVLPPGTRRRAQVKKIKSKFF